MNRIFLKLIKKLIFTILIFISPFSFAANGEWPSKPIKYVVPFSTGGVSDNVARVLSQYAEESLGQAIVVENKPGISGVAGTQFVRNADADGYTIIGGTITTHAVNPFFFKNLGYDPQKDFAPVALVGTVSNVLVVPANSPYKSVEQIIQKLKSDPDSLTYGTAGAGTSQHLSGQLFQVLTGTKMRQIAYKGGSQAMIDLVGGQIDMVFETVAAAKPMIDAKQVIPLAVTSKKRVSSLPNVPPLTEAGVPGFEMQSWQGIFAPSKTPQPIIQKLNVYINSITTSKKGREKLLSLGVEPEAITPKQFTEFQAAEMNKWSKVIKESGIQAE